MSFRVSNSVEKNVISQPFAPIVVPATAATDVLQDVTKSIGELAARYIQNVGGDDCYYAFGVNCSPTNFCGMLAKPTTLNANGHGVGQQLDVSNCGQRVSVYSIAGTIIARTVLVRNDNQQGTGNIL